MLNRHTRIVSDDDLGSDEEGSIESVDLGTCNVLCLGRKCEFRLD